MSDYRIREVFGGFVPEMQYICRTGPRTSEPMWVPLNRQGYWADPDAYSYGVIEETHVFSDRAIADRAVLRARAINGEAISQVLPADTAEGLNEVGEQGTA